MYQLTTKVIKIKKKYPFTISRGTRTHSENVFVFINDGQHIGIGEFDPVSTGEDASQVLSATQQSLQAFTQQYDLSTHAINDIWQYAREQAVPPTALAGLDMALWDLYGKQCQQPCYRIFGLSKLSVPTSMTIGITPLELIPERVAQLLANHRFRYLKIKLGAPAGIEYDQQAFELIQAAAKPFNVALRVDANGGWSLQNAKKMCQWLADRGVDYVEQPLAKDQDAYLPELFNNRPLPLFVDESCHFASDVPKFAACADGINIKLMKCGGLTEAIRMVAVARAHGLKTMIGCMSESSISISAAASIGSLFDYIDLDSAFNMDPDPARGAQLVDGAVIPTDMPGHGAELC